MIEIPHPRPVPEAVLADAERQLGLRLPGEYRDWLAATGGGQPPEDFALCNGVVTEFFAVGPSAADYNLVTNRLWAAPGGFDSWVPREHLVVAPASGGAVTVKVAGDEVGSVWWADFDAGHDLASEDPEHEGDPLPQIMERLADSWSEFVRLYP